MRTFSQDLEIVPLDRYNWEKFIHIEVEDGQKAFINSNLFLLAQANFENLNPFGINFRGQPAGLMTYGEFNGICWINHIMIEKSVQQQGLGSKSLTAMIDHLKGNRHCREIRTTVSLKNIWGLYFFEQAGFEVIEDDLGGEVILRLVRKENLA